MPAGMPRFLLPCLNPPHRLITFGVFEQQVKELLYLTLFLCGVCVFEFCLWVFCWGGVFLVF